MEEALATHHLIAGHSTLLLAGLKQLLQDQINAKVTASETEYFGMEHLLPSDFFWLEVHEQGEDCLSLCRKLASSYPKLKIVIFYDNKNPKTIREFLKAGIAAYLLPNCVVERVQEAICAVLSDRVYVDPQLHHDIASHLFNPNKRKALGNFSLTPREKEVLRLIVEENTTGEIADKLNINFSTVETHRVHLIQKMGVKNTAGLVREALMRRLYAHP